MMSSDEMTLRVLYEIRDGIRATNERVDGTNNRLDATNSCLEALTERVGLVERRQERLGEQIVESEIRTATAINETAFAIREVYKLLKDRLRDIDDIKKRLE